MDLLLPPREDKQTAEAGDAAGQEFDEVDRGFVGPMDILEYEERWAGLLVKSLQEIGKQGCCGLRGPSPSQICQMTS